MSVMAHLVIDLDTASVDVSAEAPGVEFGVAGPQGVPGPPGPTGPAGIQKVVHGSDPNVPRPAVPLVYWVGTVHPVYSDPDDLLLLKGA